MEGGKSIVEGGCMNIDDWEGHTVCSTFHLTHCMTLQSVIAVLLKMRPLTWGDRLDILKSPFTCKGQSHCQNKVMPKFSLSSSNQYTQNITLLSKTIQASTGSNYQRNNTG